MSEGGTEKILAARGPIHGDYEEGAAFTQAVMDLARGTTSWTRLRPAQKESLHMIVHKVHRILTGNPNHDDHWDDIAGYAVLGKSRVKANGSED